MMALRALTAGALRAPEVALTISALRALMTGALRAPEVALTIRAVRALVTSALRAPEKTLILETIMPTVAIHTRISSARCEGDTDDWLEPLRTAIL